MRIAEALRPAFRRWNLAELDAHAGAIYGVDRELRLACMNTAWFQFAAANSGEPRISTEWPIGRSILDCIPPAQRAFYASSYRASLDAEKPWMHEYECSSPSVYRRYHQIAYALDDRAGLLIVNSPVVECAHDAGKLPAPTDHARYLDDDGLITQCSHCRRVRQASEGDRWDWIPAWATTFPRYTSHGLCTPCYRFHYPVGA